MSEVLFCQCFNIDLGEALHNAKKPAPLSPNPMSDAHKKLLGVNLWHNNKKGRRDTVDATKAAKPVAEDTASDVRKARVNQLVAAYEVCEPLEISPFDDRKYDR
tara:strand:+ start:224 stop:535 length:312 start_codon:yes stop_codon:yes gene_type:complete